MSKFSPEKFKTYGNVFDAFTLRNLFKLSSQGYFEDLTRAIALGKEANVFLADREDGKKVIVKIYRLETCDFNQMYNYMKVDDRYQNIKRNRRFIIFSWTQREFRNLNKARTGGVDVPTPYHFMNNILIEELIGDNEPSSQIKDSLPEDIQIFFDGVIDNMKRLHKAGLVHGDLSSFNILNYNGDPIFIDMGQSMDIKSPNAREYLVRDIKNVVAFFIKKGIDTSIEDIYKQITGKDLDFYYET